MVDAQVLEQYSEEERLIINKCKEWYDNPILFCNEVLHLYPDEQQQHIITTFYNGKKRTAVKSGRGCGKTYTAGMIIWHFLCTRWMAQVYVSAPAGGTISGALWPTLAKVYENMEPFFKDQFELQSQKIVHKEHGFSWFCMARTARREQSEALAGAHAENLLFCLDEASGIEEPVFHSIFGSLTEEENYLLMLSNPRRLKGFFYESFRPINAEVYNQLTMSAINSKFVSRDSISHWKNLYGEESNTYKIEVLGQFPDTDTEAIIPLELIEEAVNKPEIPEIERYGEIYWGLDVAQGGDKSVLIKRQGNYVWPEIRKWRDKDTMITVAKVADEYHNTPKENQPVRVYVDPIGTGKGAYDRLKELGLPVYPAHAQATAFRKKYIYNAKAEWWVEMRKWFLNESPKIPNDRFLIEGLSTYRSIPSNDGRFKVEEKSKYRQRTNGLSPDESDALAMTFSLKSKKEVGLTT